MKVLSIFATIFLYQATMAMPVNCRNLLEKVESSNVQRAHFSDQNEFEMVQTVRSHLQDFNKFTTGGFTQHPAFLQARATVEILLQDKSIPTRYESLFKVYYGLENGAQSFHLDPRIKFSFLQDSKGQQKGLLSAAELNQLIEREFNNIPLFVIENALNYRVKNKKTFFRSDKLPQDVSPNSLWHDLNDPYNVLLLKALKSDRLDVKDLFRERAQVLFGKILKQNKHEADSSQTHLQVMSSYVELALLIQNSLYLPVMAKKQFTQQIEPSIYHLVYFQQVRSNKAAVKFLLDLAAKSSLPLSAEFLSSILVPPIPLTLGKLEFSVAETLDYLSKFDLRGPEIKESILSYFKNPAYIRRLKKLDHFEQIRSADFSKISLEDFILSFHAMMNQDMDFLTDHGS